MTTYRASLGTRGELRRIAAEAETAAIERVRPWSRKVQPCRLAPHVVVPQWIRSELPPKPRTPPAPPPPPIPPLPAATGAAVANQLVSELMDAVPATPSFARGRFKRDAAAAELPPPAVHEAQRAAPPVTSAPAAEPALTTPAPVSAAEPALTTPASVTEAASAADASMAPAATLADTPAPLAEEVTAGVKNSTEGPEPMEKETAPTQKVATAPAKVGDAAPVDTVLTEDPVAKEDMTMEDATQEVALVPEVNDVMEIDSGQAERSENVPALGGPIDAQVDAKVGELKVAVQELDAMGTKTEGKKVDMAAPLNAEAQTAIIAPVNTNEVDVLEAKVQDSNVHEAEVSDAVAHESDSPEVPMAEENVPQAAQFEESTQLEVSAQLESSAQVVDVKQTHVQDAVPRGASIQEASAQQANAQEGNDQDAPPQDVTLGETKEQPALEEAATEADKAKEPSDVILMTEGSSEVKQQASEQEPHASVLPKGEEGEVPAQMGTESAS